MNYSGIHWGNRQNIGDPWSYPWGIVVLLHHQMGDLAELRRRLPNAMLLVRFYTENWVNQDPFEWAKYIASLWPTIRPFTLDVCAWNEQNLASEGHPLGASESRVVPDVQVYWDMNKWNYKVIDTLAWLCPDMVFHYGAVSQSHSDDQLDMGTGYVAPGYIGLDICRESIQHPFVKYVDAHNYWDKRENIGSEWFGMRHLKLRKFMRPDQKMVVSEYGSLQALSQPDRAEQYRKFLSIVGLPSAAYIWYTYDEKKEGESKPSPWNLHDKEDLLEVFRNPPESNPEPQKLTDVEWAALAREAGFIQADFCLAIGFAESGGNQFAHNPVPPDDSYGFMQINMIGELGIARRRRYGLSNNEQLFDPRTNLLVAKDISGGGSNWTAWTTYTGGAYKGQLARARAALQKVDGPILQAGLEAAKNLPSISANDRAWLYKFGMQYGAGVPIRDEKYYSIGEKKYIYQEWSRAHLLMEQGRNETAWLIWK